MEGLLRLSRGIDAVSRVVGRAAAWAILAAVLVSAVNAIFRKVFGLSSNAWLELQWYLFGAVFMLCASWTLAANEHIRIDVVSARLSPRTRNLIEMIGHFLFLLPFAVVMTYLSAPFFWRSYQGGEVSSSAGGLILWPAKILILLGFALLLLQWVSEVVKTVAVMRGLVAETHVAGHQTAAQAEAERLLALAQEANAGAEPPPARG